MHAALDAAITAYRPVVAALTTANDLTDLQAAAQRAQAALPRLRAHSSDLQGRSGDLADGAADVVQAQVAVAEAAQRLSALDQESLAQWGEMHADLTQAVRQDTRSRAALRALNAEVGAALPNTTASLDHVEQVVGREVAGTATAATAELLEELSTARLTDDVRTIAADAARATDAITAARAGVDPQSDDGRRLAAATDVLGQVAHLAALNGDNLAVWSGVRAPLEAALDDLEDEHDGLQGSAIEGSAVEALDRLVLRAEEKLSEWEASYDAAVERREDDLAALDDYAASMRAELDAYDELRAETGDFVERIESGYVSYNEAYDVFSQGSMDRWEIRDAMDSLDVPGEVQPAHDRLVDVLDDAIAAMDSAYSGLYDSQWCRNTCYYKNTPGWRTFSDESDRITADFDAATGGWESAVADAERSIDDRALPAKPRV